MAKNEDAEFPIAKALRERIFQIPLLPQDQIIHRFAEIDALLYPMALRLAEDIPSIRNYFKEIVHKVASGNTLGKNFFNKRDNEDTKPVAKTEPTSAVFENKYGQKVSGKKEILKNSEIRILSESFALLRHSGKPDKFCKILERSGFMRGVMEESVELFFDRVADYEDLKEKLELAAKTHSLDYLEYECEIEKILLSLGLTADDASIIEHLIMEMETFWSDYLDLREQLVSPYFRLVYTIAGGFSQSDSQTLDNFQNGLIGLLRAYKCYTPSRFAAFSLVAEQWIRQSILLHIKTEVNFIKLPIANWHSYQKLEKIKGKIEQRTNREASPEEIAVEAKMPIEKVKKIYENVKLAKVLSLNVPTQNEEEQNDGPVWSLESVTDERNVQDALEKEADYQTVKKVVTQFDDEETIIFSLISGCLDLIENSAISQIDIEKEVVRQLGAQAGIAVTFKEQGKM